MRYGTRGEAADSCFALTGWLVELPYPLLASCLSS